MQHDDTVYLVHMLEMARKAVAHASGVTKDQFLANDVLEMALVHIVQVIGEAARRVSPETRERHHDIPWVEIIGMRHKVVHDYLEVDWNVVWKTVTEDLPALVSRLERIVPPALLT